MHKPTLFQVLKWSAVAGILFGLYPIFRTILLFERTHTSAMMHLTGIGITLLIGFLGYGLSALLHSFEQQKKLRVVARKLLTVFAVVLIAIISFFTVFALSPTMFYSYPIVAILSFILGVRCFFQSYRTILTGTFLLFQVIFYVVSLFALWAGGRAYNEQVLFCILCFLAVILTFFLTQNQGNIDYLMERRKHNLSHLPQKIRYYNLALLGALFAVVLLCFLLKNQILQLLTMLGNFGKFLLSLFLQALLWLSNLFRNNDTGTIIEEPPEQSFGANQAVQDQATPYFIFFLLFVIVLIIWQRKRILAFFVDVFLSVVRFLKRLLFQSKAISNQAEENGYYHDQIEDLTPIPIEKSKKQRSLLSSQWKKQYRQYQKMDSSEQKLRFGYRLLLDYMELSGKPPRLDNTTLDILNEHTSLPHFDQVTNFYNKVRYAEVAYDNHAFQSLDTTLSQAEEEIKKHRR